MKMCKKNGKKRLKPLHIGLQPANIKQVFLLFEFNNFPNGISII